MVIRGGHWTLTRAGVPSVGSIKITVISSWFVMAPLARAWWDDWTLGLASLVSGFQPRRVFAPGGALNVWSRSFVRPSTVRHSLKTVE